MCFNFNRWILCLWSASLVTCAGENRPQNPAIEVKLKNTGECLSQAGVQLNKYFKGKLSHPEVAAFWDCANQAVGEFQRLTAGENGGGAYTPQALRRFLFKHFYKERPLSDELMMSAMELKRLLLSGSNTAITREEIRLLQDFLAEMKFLSLELHPHVKVLFGEPGSATDMQVNNAARAMEQAARRLAAWLDRHQQPYSFARLKALAEALQDWMSHDQEAVALLDRLERAVPPLAAAKQIFSGGSADRIEGQSWRPFLLAAGKAFHVYLDFRHAFHGDLNSGLIRGLLPEALHHSALLLEDAIRLRGPLPFSEFNELFDRLEDSRLAPKEITQEALAGFFHWFVVRSLGGNAATDRVELKHVAKLKEHQNIWKNLLNRVNGAHFDQIPELRVFEDVLARTQPLGWDAEGRLELARKGPAVWTRDNRRRMVWPFVVIRWLKEGYVGSVEHMSEDQMMEAVSEVLPMLQKFGWLPTTKLSIGKRLVREGDLFLYPSNGDFKLDLAEATHYLLLVASGFRTAQVWLEEADQQCGGRRATCVRQLALDPASRSLDAFPHLKNAVQAQPPDKFLEYMRAAEETTLGQPVSADMNTRDLLQTLQLFQYVEIFLQFYDPDLTETIDLAEALVAYQKYGPTLSNLLSRRGLPPDEVLAFYTFMMKYGDNPFTMFGGSVYFVNWKLKRKDWAFQASRPVLMAILNQLSKL